MTKILVLRLDDEYVDGNGHLMPTDAEVEFKNDIILTHGFQKDLASVLGTAQLVREGNNFYITNMDLSTPHGKSMAKMLKATDVYPAIGGMIKKREGKKIIDFSINMVSLGIETNVDTEIKSIRRQLKEQENVD